MAGAGIQDCTLCPTDPLFHLFLVRDDRTEGDILRNTERLPFFVNSLPQDHLTGPRQVGMR